jgi:hypothetical protein
VTLSIPDSSTLEKIEIYNSLGQLMATETKNIISLEKLISGNYYLLIATSKGNYIKKIIRQ